MTTFFARFFLSLGTFFFSYAFALILGDLIVLLVQTFSWEGVLMCVLAVVLSAVAALTPVEPV